MLIIICQVLFVRLQWIRLALIFEYTVMPFLVSAAKANHRARNETAQYHTIIHCVGQAHGNSCISIYVSTVNTRCSHQQSIDQGEGAALDRYGNHRNKGYFHVLVGWMDGHRKAQTHLYDVNYRLKFSSIVLMFEAISKKQTQRNAESVRSR